MTEVPLLSRSVLDRAEELRSDTGALRAGWAEAAVLQIDHRGQARVDGAELVLVPARSLADAPIPGAVFLGRRDGRHLWAQRVPALIGRVADLRTIGHRLDDSSAGLLTSAVAVLNWHAAAGFSAIDGTPTTPTTSGWSRHSSTGHEEFPRTDPAVICLVHDGADRVLLARNGNWPERRFSVLAGFVEAGESLEACVAREIAEEVGVTVRDIRYLGSQPWPFPRSVMIGFSAVGDPDQPLVFSDGEIEEAHWFGRDQVREALALGDWSSPEDTPLLVPGSVSIARGMLEAWVK